MEDIEEDEDNPEDQKAEGFDYDRFMMVDLNMQVQGKVLAIANGYREDHNIATDFEGSRLFSVYKHPERHWQVYHTQVNLDKSKKTFLMKNKQFVVRESEEFGNLPASLCFVDKCKKLFIGTREGPILVFEITFSDADKIPKKELISVHRFNLVDSLKKEKKSKKKDFKKKDYTPDDKSEDSGTEHTNFFEEIIPNYDESYLLARTYMSSVVVLSILPGKLELVRRFRFSSSIQHMALSANGRYLATCGIFIDSIKRIDLSVVDPQAFGNGCLDFMKYIDKLADPQTRKNAANEKKRQDKMICYRYGSKKKYYQMIEKNRKKHLINEQKKEIKKYESKFRKKRDML